MASSHNRLPPEFYGSGEGDEDAEKAEAAYNAADRQQVKERARGQQQLEEQLQAALSKLLSSKGGRQLWHWLAMKRCRAMDKSAGADVTVPGVLQYDAGRRDVGLDLLDMALRCDANSYMLMLAENQT